MAINYNDMQQGYAFAASFQAAYLEAIRPHQNLRFYQVRRLNDNTAFMLVNGNRGMLIVTKWRSGPAGGHLFGINANDWHWWLNPCPVPVVDLQIPLAQRKLHEVGASLVAILAYTTYRPENYRLFAQRLGQIRVAAQGPEFVDTELASYANLSTILQEGIDMEPALAQQIEQQTLQNALANPLLNPNAR